jgi:hypothetical protein
MGVNFNHRFDGDERVGNLGPLIHPIVQPVVQSGRVAASRHGREGCTVDQINRISGMLLNVIK